MGNLSNHKIQELFVIRQHQDGFERYITKRESRTLNLELAMHFEKYEDCIPRIMDEVKMDMERPKRFHSDKPSYYEIQKLHTHPNHVKFEK